MTLRIGILGCGAIAAARHAPEYHDNPNCTLAGFCDAVPGRAEALAAKFGGRVYSDPDELLRSPDIDAVSVCTANHTHAPMTIAALAQGKHVLCEKPMAVTLTEARRMLEAADRAERILMIGHNQRFVPAYRMARERLLRGDLGRVISFEAELSHKGPESWCADKNAGTWFFKKDAAAFGVLGDLGIHKCDLMGWLLGDPIAGVSARLMTLDKRYETGELINVDDYAMCLCRTEGGIPGSLVFSWCNYGRECNRVILYCEKGKMRIFDDREHDIIIERRDGAVETLDTGGISTNDRQLPSGVIDAFVDAVLGTAPLVSSGLDGYRALAVVTACQQSAQSGRWETVAAPAVEDGSGLFRRAAEPAVSAIQ